MEPCTPRLRQMLTTFINALMSVAVCGAEYGTRSAERTNVRNGYRSREFDTRAGTLDVAILRASTATRKGRRLCVGLLHISPRDWVGLSDR